MCLVAIPLSPTQDCQSLEGSCCPSACCHQAQLSPPQKTLGLLPLLERGNCHHCWPPRVVKTSLWCSQGHSGQAARPSQPTQSSFFQCPGLAACGLGWPRREAVRTPGYLQSARPTGDLPGSCQGSARESASSSSSYSSLLPLLPEPIDTRRAKETRETLSRHSVPSQNRTGKTPSCLFLPSLICLALGLQWE